VDEAGKVQAIDSADVNEYLQTITGEAFTSKDFRTWAGTACTAQVLHELGPPDSESQAQAHVRTAIEAAAQHLGNRVATCRNFYVHPAIPDAYLEGWLLEVWQQAAGRSPSTSTANFTPTEQALIGVLEAVRDNG
jgi:DNA topoisomerase-1